jgi:glycosyltransferase involved in cell wall biosynthesis
MTHRIAVLLPFRDVSRWLDEAITSVRAEPEVDALLLIDDGSVDASSHIAAMHAAADPRIALIRTDGIGLPRALELGRARAAARYLARMDGDDVSVPGRIAQQAAYLDACPSVAAVGARVEAFPDVGEGLARYVAWQNALLTPRAHHDALFVEAPLCHPSVTLRASALAEVGGFRDGPFPEDYDLWLRLDAAGHGLAKLDATLLRWRHREDRLTFRDPRYAPEAHRALKARFLAARLRDVSSFVVWGAGPTGKRLARALEAHGVRPEAFVDIDPAKVGRSRRGAPVWSADTLRDARARPFVVVAVGARGARDLITAELVRWGLVEGEGFLAAS